MTPTAGVSVVLPVLNGRRHLPSVLRAIRRECAGRPFEILAVDDGSTDGSLRALQRDARRGAMRVLEGGGRGQAAAINRGIREARYPFICQIDQDVVLHDGWLRALLRSLVSPEVAAAQGWFMAAPGAGFWAKMMGHDLEARYRTIPGPWTDHACTGNAVYRATALHQVGLFDERFGYGADNDLSYRLGAAGYRLAFCPAARSTHFWRDSARGYLQQQFGVGYGRLDVIRKHPRRMRGDRVSGPGMMLHAALTTVAVACLVATAAAAVAGIVLPQPPLGAAIIAAALAIERGVAGVRAWRATGDRAALAFPVAHLLRDLAWAAAVMVWTSRRLRGRRASPRQSMAAPNATPVRIAAAPTEPRPMIVIPAHNEAASLPHVIAELERLQPGIPIVVVNDASTDETEALLRASRVRWMTLRIRTGVGGAMRAVILYVLRHDCTHAVRLDGDGQHRARDVARLLAAVTLDGADAAVGSRAGRRGAAPGIGRLALGAWLSALTGRRVSDPTSGYWAFGPRALSLLARHHPSGYPEPELMLLLHRNRLVVSEVPVWARARLAGRTSLTPGRVLHAFARTLLALVVVPFRRAEAQLGAPR